MAKQAMLFMTKVARLLPEEKIQVVHSLLLAGLSKILPKKFPGSAIKP